MEASDHIVGGGYSITTLHTERLMIMRRRRMPRLPPYEDRWGLLITLRVVTDASSFRWDIY